MMLLTTLNMNHSMLLAEERAQYIMEHTSNHDAVLLQEVHPDMVNILQQKAERWGWVVNVGQARQHPTYIYMNVTLTKEPGTVSTGIVPEVLEGIQVPYLGVTLKDIVLFNVHFPWGSAAEHSRLMSAVHLSLLASEQNPDHLVVMGGDLNAVPESSTVRYLRGLDAYNTESVYWTDLWLGSQPPATARKTGGWAEDIAHHVGCEYPERMPNRTVDYLMTYGWNHGRRGDIEYVGLFGSEPDILPNGYSLSDHHGVTARVLW